MSMEQIPLPEGILQGESRAGYTVFKGVPYAAPPVGELRFAPPQPPRPWPGVYTADHFSAACPQLPEQPGSFYEKEFYSPPERQPRMDEDCLYLNIWTPAAAPEEQLPVALWIHGGAFDHGFGHEIEFDGAAFCRRGVVLVTVNYRVNVFGFLSHPWLEEGADNLGIRDQIAALSWVRTHIKAFGGNPDNITVFGQSAGAISTQTLVSSPLTGGDDSQSHFSERGRIPQRPVRRPQPPGGGSLRHSPGGGVGCPFSCRSSRHSRHGADAQGNGLRQSQRQFPSLCACVGQRCAPRSLRHSDRAGTGRPYSLSAGRHKE